MRYLLVLAIMCLPVFCWAQRQIQNEAADAYHNFLIDYQDSVLSQLDETFLVLFKRDTLNIPTASDSLNKLNLRAISAVTARPPYLNDSVFKPSVLQLLLYYQCFADTVLPQLVSLYSQPTITVADEQLAKKLYAAFEDGESPLIQKLLDEQYNFATRYGLILSEE
ncbi:MAG: hypothetical protein SFW35_06610 [Chitinophagales bacterium]|nr:hypothetical protein [Chitinophagales bacterium]